MRRKVPRIQDTHAQSLHSLLGLALSDVDSPTRTPFHLTGSCDWIFCYLPPISIRFACRYLAMADSGVLETPYDQCVANNRCVHLVIIFDAFSSSYFLNDTPSDAFFMSSFPFSTISVL